MEPVVEVGQNVLLVGVNRGSYDLYTVAYVEPFPRSWPLVFDLGALAAGAQSANWPAAGQGPFDLNDGELGQFRMQVLDDVWLYEAQPNNGLSRNQLKSIRAALSLFETVKDPDAALSEFYLFEDERIYLQATNPTNHGLQQVRIALWGFRLVLSGLNGASAASKRFLPKMSFTSIEDALAARDRAGNKIPFTVVPTGGWGS